jgi:hypothetical protein
MWILVLKPPLERPRASVFGLPLFSGGRLLMSPHDGSVDHEILVPRIRGEDLEDLFPEASIRPSGEALVGAFPVTVTFRHMAPIRSATQNPQDSVDKGSVVRGSSASVSSFVPGSRSLISCHCASVNSYRLLISTSLGCSYTSEAHLSLNVDPS